MRYLIGIIQFKDIIFQDNVAQISKPKGQDLEDLVGFENNTKQGRISHVLLFMSPSQIKDEVLNEIKSERQKKNKCTAMSE